MALLWDIIDGEIQQRGLFVTQAFLFVVLIRQLFAPELQYALMDEAQTNLVVSFRKILSS
jgi:hypothetical protein